ncbi:MAG TPA: hypothetical protein VFC00_12245, partial [Micromonosporaceae bacterium]|nr:hypothetical protein [Micromonosporaceae bacterium]
MRSFSPWPDPPIIKPPNASVEWEPHAHSGRSRMSRKPNTPRYRGGRGSSHPGGRGLGRGGGNRPGGIR